MSDEQHWCNEMLYSIAASYVLNPTNPGLYYAQVPELVGLPPRALFARARDLAVEGKLITVSEPHTLLPAGAEIVFGHFAEPSVETRDPRAFTAVQQAVQRAYDEIGKGLLDLSVAEAQFVSDATDDETAKKRRKAFQLAVAVAGAHGLNIVRPPSLVYVDENAAPTASCGGGSAAENSTQCQIRDLVGTLTSAGYKYQTARAAHPLEQFGLWLRDNCIELEPWWTQTVEDMRSVPMHCQTPKLVAYAALAEGVLTTTVLVAVRESMVAPNKGPDPDVDKAWNFNNLLHAACCGKNPIVNGDLRARLVKLNEDRQRIHAGRFRTTTFQALQPARVEDARHTVTRLAEAALDWWERSTADAELPPTAGASDESEAQNS